MATSAATASLYKRQLALNYDVPKSNGKVTTKQMKFKNIDQTASLDSLYAIGSEISKLLSVSITEIETIDNSKINPGA